MAFTLSNSAHSLSLPKIGTLIPNRIFVGGITSNTTEDDLRSFFSAFGPIRDVKVIYDRSGLAKGSYGFVTFENQETAETIIKNEAKFGGALLMTNGAIPCVLSNGLSFIQLPNKDYSLVNNHSNVYSTTLVLPQNISSNGGAHQTTNAARSQTTTLLQRPTTALSSSSSDRASSMLGSSPLLCTHGQLPLPPNNMNGIQTLISPLNCTNNENLSYFIPPVRHHPRPGSHLQAKASRDQPQIFPQVMLNGIPSFTNQQAQEENGIILRSKSSDYPQNVQTCDTRIFLNADVAIPSFITSNGSVAFVEEPNDKAPNNQGHSMNACAQSTEQMSLMNNFALAQHPCSASAGSFIEMNPYSQISSNIQALPQQSATNLRSKSHPHIHIISPPVNQQQLIMQGGVITSYSFPQSVQKSCHSVNKLDQYKLLVPSAVTIGETKPNHSHQMVPNSAITSLMQTDKPLRESVGYTCVHGQINQHPICMFSAPTLVSPVHQNIANPNLLVCKIDKTSNIRDPSSLVMPYSADAGTSSISDTASNFSSYLSSSASSLTTPSTPSINCSLKCYANMLQMLSKDSFSSAKSGYHPSSDSLIQNIKRESPNLPNAHLEAWQPGSEQHQHRLSRITNISGESENVFNTQVSDGKMIDILKYQYT
ncbi:unnamed protein product [Protopolystoma xenopodis]|uniref:RRM domain-containing protein n=1 Tax=Protopolystoma xenopodis TaxID=117903 RepID=A0A3S4ZS24_9PLAT|nr:unnamed protein product [Protopolystoma xenopodis]